MKKKLGITMLLAMMIMVIVSAIPVSAASNKSKALAAYKKFLSKKQITVTLPAPNLGKKKTVKTSEMKFAIIYLDKDSVPELLLRNDDGNFIFQYKNKKVKQVYASWLRDMPKQYFKKKSVIVVDDNWVSFNYYTYYQIKGSKQTFIVCKSDSGYSISEDEWKEVSAAKYKSLLKKYVGSTKATKITFYKNTKANRNKRLK